MLCRAWQRVVRRYSVFSALYPKIQFTTLNMIYNQFPFLSSPIGGRNQRFLHLTLFSAHMGLFSAFFTAGHRKYRQEQSSMHKEIAVDQISPLLPLLMRSISGFVTDFRLQIFAPPCRQLTLQMSAGCRTLVAHLLGLSYNEKKRSQKLNLV